MRAQHGRGSRRQGLQQDARILGVTTHWHWRDHFGGMAALANQIPIREFIDHGANVQPDAVADAFPAGRPIPA